jgi:hypothetical protein
MKNLNVSLAELESLPILELGDYLLNNRRKKRVNKLKQNKEPLVVESGNHEIKKQKIENLFKEEPSIFSKQNNIESIEKTNEFVETPDKAFKLPLLNNSSGKCCQSPGKI